MPDGTFQKGGGTSELEQACLSGVPPSCVTEARLFSVGHIFIIDEHGALLKGIFNELKTDQ